MNTALKAITQGMLDREISIAKDAVLRIGIRAYLKSAMIRQITNCISNDNYRAGIYVSERSRLDIIAELLKEIVEEYHMISDSNNNRSIIVSQNEVVMKFESGSVMRAVVASENSRACKFNDIICDHYIEKDLIENVLKHTFINFDHFNPDSREYNLKFIECEI